MEIIKNCLKPLSSKRMYYKMASTAFKYSIVLAKNKREDEAQEKFEQGIQYLPAYGFRKDRTLSEVLYPAVPFQKQYGTLSPEWFYDIYYLSMTVVTHTDGKGTHSYPIEWFKEFLQAYPIEALKFLISETLESSFANYHQENQLYGLLKNADGILTSTQWFLLLKTLPIASSNKIIKCRRRAS